MARWIKYVGALNRPLRTFALNFRNNHKSYIIYLNFLLLNEYKKSNITLELAIFYLPTSPIYHHLKFEFFGQTYSVICVLAHPT